ncbi:hypothetical protein ABZ642_29735 [Streptomyces sp. NPDC007157]
MGLVVLACSDNRGASRVGDDGYVAHESGPARRVTCKGVANGGLTP